jgi:hypothetical protein
MLDLKSRPSAEPISGVGLLRVYVEKPDASAAASWHSDQCLGPLRPPCANLLQINRCPIDPGFYQWLLVDLDLSRAVRLLLRFGLPVAWNDGNAVAD